MSGPAKWLEALRRGISTLSPNCQQAARLQSDALDRKLSLFQRAGLGIHLLLCKWCRRYGKHLGLLRAASCKCAHEDHDPRPQSLSTEARERIKRRLQAEENQARPD